MQDGHIQEVIMQKLPRQLQRGICDGRYDENRKTTEGEYSSPSCYRQYNNLLNGVRF
jgi:hypothetical protein